MALLTPAQPLPLAPPASAAAGSVPFGKPEGGWRLAVYRVIFESETPAGRLFDQVLIALILLSVGVVVVDSMPSVHARWHTVFGVMEWIFTAAFTLEYAARLACLRRPLRYARSFFGAVDLLALLPTYMALVFPALHVLIDVRVLRLLRVFRIFKLAAYASEFQTLGHALNASRRKITVFLAGVLMIVLVAGTLMYLIEGQEHGFTSIPTAVYWAITTMTTVGFGDIAPHTALGRFVSSVMMLLGWGTLAVPTGIVTAEMTARHGARVPFDARRCSHCGTTGHPADADFCRRCGTGLPGGTGGATLPASSAPLA
ncbi:MAG: ion transporter [Pseudomonadota bacterium]